MNHVMYTGHSHAVISLVTPFLRRGLRTSAARESRPLARKASGSALSPPPPFDFEFRYVKMTEVRNLTSSRKARNR
jgi:hypothetical protein